MAETPLRHRGGNHIETTVLMNALSHAGVRDPSSKEPMAEATVLGIAGGIGAGLSVCPSVQRNRIASGVSVIGRARSAATDGGFHKDLLERLGVPFRCVETSSPNAAEKKLAAELERGGPVIVQCSKELPYYGGGGPHCGVSTWAWDVLVYEIDQDARTAVVGDLSDVPLRVDLDSLSEARNQTCTHKNRSFALEPRPRALGVGELREAMRVGIEACVEGLQNPRMKTFSLAHLATWAKQLRNVKAKSGWLSSFPGGDLYWVLRDVYTTIEAEDGGGLMRGMYADFLEHAAAVLRKKKLAACADSYRALAQQWTALAEAALPSEIAPFAETKQLLSAQVERFAAQGPAAEIPCASARQRLGEIDAEMQRACPLAGEAAAAHLSALADRVDELHAAELAALEKLAQTVA
ncbi:BtrH N-terminal domain-containing protein [Haliangium ochraceum]|uniref:DUF4872 domain-containing protein n=1 Tax=Haliangium ochraceum (strain DSM 14365 / JCM 11303 / SMP-2) TaxID=502025 RepID=D0LJV5_HALO1|nr:BtrH N-terminal domain-containing protein [Haliangium ochraceum]ACY18462.1 hypothetical protein Hoch_5987 [Haliangium ochraceum DSM 14365]